MGLRTSVRSLALLILLCPAPSHAIDTHGTPDPAAVGSLPAVAPAAILYDQTDDPQDPLSNITSQDFEAAQDIYDSQAADDFIVPTGGWTITGVDVMGTYTGGPAASFHVFFYANSGDLPGAVEATRLAQTFVEAGGDVGITISPAVVLGPGKHWVSVQARQDLSPAGQWFWDIRAGQRNDPAAWRNPGNGFGSGCTSFGVRASCITTQIGADQLFRLVGTGAASIFADGFESGSRCLWSDPLPDFGFDAAMGGVIVPGVDDTGNHADDSSTAVILPFPVKIYDQTFSTVNVGSNGHLTFGTVNNAFNPTCIPIGTATYALGPYWTDQCTGNCQNVTCTGCGIFTSTSGTAPHRIFNIEYRTRYYNSGGTGVPLNYEVRLFEGLRRYEVIYGTVSPFTPPAARNLSIGVQQNSSAGNNTLVACDNTGGTSPPVLSGDVYTFEACAAP